jgi:hypothetical protein
MLVQLAVATAMVLITVMMHGLGLALLGRAMQGELKQERDHHVPTLSARGLGFTLALVLALAWLHGLEIWSYAFLYEALGAVADLETPCISRRLVTPVLALMIAISILHGDWFRQ